MASMSYCMFENTHGELGQCVDAMSEAETLSDLDMNEYEKQAFFAMWNTCREFLAEHERLLNAEHELCRVQEKAFADSLSTVGSHRLNQTEGV